MAIYVETFIRAPIDGVWRHTQDPVLHEQWDLRFTRIEYLPRETGEPQRFRYATRIGFGLQVEGTGESIAERDSPDGSRTSSLRFGSDDPKSLIREGSGYWRYIPEAEGVRFLTWYHYGTRFGLAGRLLDGCIFQPLLGWATAWSFDRLRLWLERGINPGSAFRLWLVHIIARLTLAFVFIYHGLVPKLLARDRGELDLIRAAGIPEGLAVQAVVGLGIAEIILGLLLGLGWRVAWTLVFILIAMPVATLTVVSTSPGSALAAFNPITLNGCVIALASIALVCSHDVPSAARCRRAPTTRHP